MSGVVVNVAPLRSYNFGDLRQDAGGAVQANEVVAQRIDVTGACSGTLIVRVSELDITNANDKIQVVFAPDAYSPEIPGTQFDIAPDENNSTTIELTSAVTAPAYLQASLPAQLGQYGQVAVLAVRDTSSSSTNSMDVEMEIDLVIRDCP